jgi:hypothetical protein
LIDFGALVPVPNGTSANLSPHVPATTGAQRARTIRGIDHVCPPTIGIAIDRLQATASTSTTPRSLRPPTAPATRTPTPIPPFRFGLAHRSFSISRGRNRACLS